jgi:hypothetical protein
MKSMDSHRDSRKSPGGGAGHYSTLNMTNAWASIDVPPEDSRADVRETEQNTSKQIVAPIEAVANRKKWQLLARSH